MKSFDCYKVLEDLIVDEDLIKLNKLTSRFNVFDSLGVSTQEIKHSNFLSFILDPTKPHGLDDTFLREFLVSVARSSETVKAITVLLWDLGDVVVHREKDCIDIQIISEKNRFACAIENKVGAKESANQLANYRKKIEDKHADWENIFFVFLTPDGRDGETDSGWAQVGYEKIVSLIDKVVSLRPLDPFFKQILNDYKDLVMKEILEMQPEIIELCRDIYQRHGEAIRMISKVCGDPRSKTYEYIIDWLKDRDDCLYGESSSFLRYIKIGHKEINDAINRIAGSPQGNKEAHFVFVIENVPEKPLSIKPALHTEGSDVLEKLAKELCLTRGKKYKSKDAHKMKDATPMQELSEISTDDINEWLSSYFEDQIPLIKKAIDVFFKTATSLN